MIGFGKLSLKEYGIPFSFGGKLGSLLLLPLIFGIGWIIASRENFFRKFRFPLIPFFLFLLWIGTISCFHMDQAAGAPSSDGTPTLLYFLSGLGTLFLTFCALRDPDILKKILLCLILGMVATVLRGGVDYFFSEGKFEVTGSCDQRLFTPFGHPNFLGGALLLILPFAWTFEWKLLCKTKIKSQALGRFLGWLVNGILALGLLFSYSRSAWLGTGISLLCLLFFCFRKQILWGAIILFSVSILVILSFSKPCTPWNIPGNNPLLSRFYSLLDFKNDPNVIERIYAWKTALHIASDHALVGIGPGNDRFKKEFTQKREAESMLLMPHAHNVLIQIAVVFGFPGLVFFVILAGGGIFRALVSRQEHEKWERLEPFPKSLHIACLCSAIGFFFYSLLDCPLFADRVSPLFWALVGISYSTHLKITSTSKSVTAQ